MSGVQRSVAAAVLAGGGRVGVVRSADEMLGLLDRGAYREQGVWNCMEVPPREQAARAVHILLSVQAKNS
jgi:hypothetical protein